MPRAGKRSAERAHRVAVKVRNGWYAREHVRGAAERGEAVRAAWCNAVNRAHACAHG
jgi:hypothetical protein